MSYTLEFNEEAYREYIDAYISYREQKAGLGERFMENVGACLQTISIHPEYYALKKYNYREARVKIFPYTIVYEIFKKGETIHIAAIYHGKRSPRRKYRKNK